MDAGKEAGIEPWEQQPGETQWEYTIWCAFRDSFPGKQPTYGQVAKQLKTSYNVVKKVSQRWSFPARLQIWIRECERVTLAQRRQEVLDMNKDHITLARNLRDKIKIVVDNLDPLLVKPGEISGLIRASTELERKARLDNITMEAMQTQDAIGTEAKKDDKATPKKDDLGEIIGILAKAGVLGDITRIGVRQTTEVVLDSNKADGG